MASSLDGLNPAQLKAVETAEKLMRLAGKNPNRHEAEAAAAKAMKILEDLNLDMSAIEQGGTEKAKRSDEKMAGGLYKWQRDLWTALAELHFCYYWNQYNYDPDKKNIYQSRMQGRRVMGGYKFEHRLVGRTVNIVAVRNMAQYLETTVERLTKEYIVGSSLGGVVVTAQELFSKRATSFRQGIAEEVVSKIYDRRSDLLAEERRKEHEAQERAAQSGMAGVSTSRAMTIGSVAKQEEEANYDFLRGEGAWAKRKAKMAEQSQRLKEAEEEYTKWAAANPDEARKQEQERLKQSRRRTSWNAGMRSERDSRDWSAYTAGRSVGRSVSIDQQAGQTRAAGAIG